MIQRDWNADQNRWVDHREMRSRGIEIHDAKDQKICFVRGFWDRGDFITVNCLIPVQGKDGTPQVAALSLNRRGEADVLEVSFRLIGGKVVFNDQK